MADELPDLSDAEIDALAAASGIHINPAHKGLLHKDLGVPQGEKIPEAKIEKAAHSPNVALAKRARFAEAADHWHHV